MCGFYFRQFSVVLNLSQKNRATLFCPCSPCNITTIMAELYHSEVHSKFLRCDLYKKLCKSSFCEKYRKIPEFRFTWQSRDTETLTPMSSNCGSRLFRVVYADEEWIKLLFACSMKTPSGTGAIVAKAKAVLITFKVLQRAVTVLVSFSMQINTHF